MTQMPCSRAHSPIAFVCSGEYTAPVGFDGELTQTIETSSVQSSTGVQPASSAPTA